MKQFLREEYPRPQYRRSVWQPLNGEWEFCFDDGQKGEAKGYTTGKIKLEKVINVPFAYQCKASGIAEREQHETMWYRRSFRMENGLTGGRVLLCFNAVDYIATVWVNGNFVVRHEGGYTYFDCDVTDALKTGENVIVVKAEDAYDTAQPRGKQFWKKETDRCWYHGTSGIWQSVWLERVGNDRLKAVTAQTDIDENAVCFTVETDGKADTLEIAVCYHERLVKTQTVTLDGPRTEIAMKLLAEDSIDEVHFWSPESPNLYDVTYTLLQNGKVADSVASYFAFRKISLDGGQIRLNHYPYYQKLILDQGYWKDTELTPPSAEALKEDIILAKQMGFNGARKHQKVEDPYYYFYADHLGFLVWGEMPSAYSYCADEVAMLTDQYIKLVRQLSVFPSIVAWVPLNESWGVRKLLVSEKQKSFARSMYYLTKSLDNSRLVSTNDGWELVADTDIIGIHDYAYNGDGFENKYVKQNINTVYPMRRRLMGYGEKAGESALFFTEYGGIALTADIKDGAWGYCHTENTKEDFYRRYESLNRGVFASEVQGFCYTQLTDVQQEVNGLLDANHKPKFDMEKIKELNSEEHYK